MVSVRCRFYQIQNFRISTFGDCKASLSSLTLLFILYLRSSIPSLLQSSWRTNKKQQRRIPSRAWRTLRRITSTGRHSRGFRDTNSHLLTPCCAATTTMVRNESSLTMKLILMREQRHPRGNAGMSAPLAWTKAVVMATGNFANATRLERRSPNQELPRCHLPKPPPLQGQGRP